MHISIRHSESVDSEGPTQCTESRGASLWVLVCGTDFILQLLPSAFMVYGVLNMVSGSMLWRCVSHPMVCYYGFLVAVN